MVYVGLDLGKVGDPSALAVVEYREQVRAWQPSIFQGLHVRYLERIPLGTPYTDVADRVLELLNHQKMWGGCWLTMDATGVGVPVVDLLRRARLPCAFTPVTITAGEKAHSKGEWWYVPKKDLIGTVSVLLERGELRIPVKLRETEALMRELLNVEMSHRPSGSMRLGADGSGQHDDLVLALSLACWQARRPLNGFGKRRLPGM